MTIFIMMSVAITHNGIDSLSGGKSYSDNEQAYMAALSGVELAKAELCENKKWGVTLNSTENTPQQNRSNEDLIVESGKDFVTAAILGLLFGGIGVHKFYLGKPIWGILYLLFFWTGIPSLFAFIESISYLCTPDDAWNRKY